MNFESYINYILVNFASIIDNYHTHLFKILINNIEPLTL